MLYIGLPVFLLFLQKVTYNTQSPILCVSFSPTALPFPPLPSLYLCTGIWGFIYVCVSMCVSLFTQQIPYYQAIELFPILYFQQCYKK